MTRETKVGLAVACSFLCLVGIVLASKLREGEEARTAAPPDAAGGPSGALAVKRTTVPVKPPERPARPARESSPLDNPPPDLTQAPVIQDMQLVSRHGHAESKPADPGPKAGEAAPAPATGPLASGKGKKAPPAAEGPGGGMSEGPPAEDPNTDPNFKRLPPGGDAAPAEPKAVKPPDAEKSPQKDQARAGESQDGAEKASKEGEDKHPDVGINQTLAEQARLAGGPPGGLPGPEDGSAGGEKPKKSKRQRGKGKGAQKADGSGDPAATVKGPDMLPDTAGPGPGGTNPLPLPGPNPPADAKLPDPPGEPHDGPTGSAVAEGPALGPATEEKGKKPKAKKKNAGAPPDFLAPPDGDPAPKETNAPAGEVPHQAAEAKMNEEPARKEAGPTDRPTADPELGKAISIPAPPPAGKESRGEEGGIPAAPPLGPPAADGAPAGAKEARAAERGSRPPDTPPPLPALGSPAVVGSPPIPVPGPAGGVAPRVESFDLETHQAGPAETFGAISKNYYHSDQYGRALLQFNRDYQAGTADLSGEAPALQAGQTVLIPPLDLLEKRYASLIPNYQPVRAHAPSAAVPVRAEAPPALVEKPEPSAPAVVPASAWSTPPGNPTYRVQGRAETLYEIARKTLGDHDRWNEIYRLNPQVAPEKPVPEGTVLRLPAPREAPARP